jgi:RAT1-interacting protein
LLTPYHLAVSQGIDPAKPRRFFGDSSTQNSNNSTVLPRPMTTSGFPPRCEARVLVLGCGNSMLAEDMWKDGWTGGIMNVDFSQVVIDKMQAKYNDDFFQTFQSYNRQHTMGKRPLEFLCADVMEGLPFEDASFDLIVCKGTLDAILQTSGAGSNCRFTMQECHRVLRGSHAALVVVTHGNPESRLVHFENAGNEWWEAVGIHTLAKPPHMTEQDGPRYGVFVESL